jgi:hypothetical protein
MELRSRQRSLIGSNQLSNSPGVFVHGDTIVPRQKPNRTTPSQVDSKVVEFLSRADLLHLRGRRNYNRYMLFTKGFVAADSPERIRWQRESAEESNRDAAWNRRHGRVPGGASVLQWRDKHEDGARPSASVR